MAIHCLGLSVSYSNHEVIDNLNFSFNKGGLYFLLGNNGSGKTTILKSIRGFLEYKGSIKLDDIEIAGYAKRTLARNITYLEQDHPFDFDFTVEELIRMGRFPYLGFLGNYKKNDLEKIETVLNAFQIDKIRCKVFNNLSGGERQKVWLSLAMVQDTPYLLLDEPTQKLDIRSKIYFFESISAITQSGKTVICSTHDVEYLCNYDGIFLILERGQILKSGKTRTQLDMNYFRKRKKETEN